MNTQQQSLLADIRLVAKEISEGSGARAFAAWIGLQRSGVEPDADELFGFCEHKIGHKATQEGFVELDEDEIADDELFLGYRMPFSSMDAYIRLHEHFDHGWLLESLLIAAKQNHQKLAEAQKEARAWMARAREGYDAAAGAELERRLHSASEEISRIFSSIRLHNQLMDGLDIYAA